MSAIRRTFSPAMLVACIALAVALGGTGYAAMVLPANSVGTLQLKANAVNGPKVKDGSLTLADLRAGTIDAPEVVVRTYRTTTGAGVSSDAAPVACEDGEVAVGGGASYDNGAGGTLRTSIPMKAVEPAPILARDGDTPTGWYSEFVPNSTTGSFATLHFAICLRP
jgi:hypothetical protein